MKLRKQCLLNEFNSISRYNYVNKNVKLFGQISEVKTTPIGISKRIYRKIKVGNK